MIVAAAASTEGLSSPLRLRHHLVISSAARVRRSLRSSGNISAHLRVLMARMPLSSSPSMTRKVLALVVVLIVFSLAPATAVIGFCARMPCCFGEAHDGAVLGANHADCCTTINCYETPSHELTVSAKAKSVTPIAPAVLPRVAVFASTHVERRAFDDTSPPPTTKQRLSSLSTLLI